MKERSWITIFVFKKRKLVFLMCLGFNHIICFTFIVFILKVDFKALICMKVYNHMKELTTIFFHVSV